MGSVGVKHHVSDVTTTVIGSVWYLWVLSTMYRCNDNRHWLLVQLHHSGGGAAGPGPAVPFPQGAGDDTATARHSRPERHHPQPCHRSRLQQRRLFDVLAILRCPARLQAWPPRPRASRARPPAPSAGRGAGQRAQQVVGAHGRAVGRHHHCLRQSAASTCAGADDAAGPQPLVASSQGD